MENRNKSTFSVTFLWLSVLFCVCLVASNLFATKVISVFGINLPGAVVIFPISYILNDCIVEVWGYRKARLVIWMGFAMNFFVILAGQIVVWLPAASFWEGAPHFDFMFNMAPRVAFASLLAFLVGSTLNSLVLSKMKIADEGRRFGFRAILSSVAGEFADSLIFIPIAFIGTPAKALLAMMLAQVTFKLCYELLILPVTTAVVRKLKVSEQTDVYDNGISYNPFKIGDL
ncbi:MAG: queuosine precursor transporter [Bacteroidales bacterium]|nr:queuosine precursor transporter [Bacteroidales bacterium]